MSNWLSRMVGRVRKRPGSPDGLFAAALEAHQRLDTGGAVAAYERLLEVAPDHVDGLANLAGLLGQTGELDRAHSLVERALTLSPDHAGALVNAGHLARVRGDIATAEHCYDAALQSAPGDAGTIRAAAGLKLDSGRAAEALPLLEQVARLLPGDAQAHYDLGVAFGSLGNLEQAVREYEAALAISSDHFAAHANLGNLLRQLDRLDEALTRAESALHLAPGNPLALNNLAGILGARAEPERGLEFVEEALRADPDYLPAHINRGGLLASLGRLDEARTALEHALALAPDADEARFTLALVQLGLGHLREGWDAYEAGLRSGGRNHTTRGLPRWSGEPIPGLALLFLPEQGIGDEIMFASCIPDAMARAATREVTLICEPRLVPLMQRSFPPLRVLAAGSATAVDAGARFEIPIGSLPRLLRHDQDSFGSGAAYLKTDDKVRDAFRSQLPAGPKVGISWRGGHDTRSRRERSIGLLDWLPVLQTPGLSFVNLQYGDTAAERDRLEQLHGIRLHTLPAPDPLVDMDGFAALVGLMDLVISVDNSTVHLAGAIGTPTWALLAEVADWRWRQAGETTAWYGSVQLCRPRDGESRTAQLERIAQALSDWRETR